MTIEDKRDAILEYCTGRHTERCIVHGKDCKLLNVCKGALGFNNSDVSCKCIDIKRYTDETVEYLFSLIYPDSDNLKRHEQAPQYVLNSVYDAIVSLNKEINEINEKMQPLESQMSNLEYSKSELKERRASLERWFYEHGGTGVSLEW